MLLPKTLSKPNQGPTPLITIKHADSSAYNHSKTRRPSGMVKTSTCNWIVGTQSASGMPGMGMQLFNATVCKICSLHGVHAMACQAMAPHAGPTHPDQNKGWSQPLATRPYSMTHNWAGSLSEIT